MVISRESDYAIRILRALADGEKHSTRALCEAEQIPAKFGQKIVSKLQNKNLIRCERGKYGGIILNCDLRETSVFDVLQAVDNECYLNQCLTPGYECQWKERHPEQCRVHHNLRALQITVDNSLKGLKLFNLMFEDITQEA